MSLRSAAGRVAAPTPTPEVQGQPPALDAPGEIQCSRCGERNPRESRFCPACGMATGGGWAPPFQVPYSAQPPQVPGSPAQPPPGMPGQPSLGAPALAAPVALPGQPQSALSGQPPPAMVAPPPSAAAPPSSGMHGPPGQAASAMQGQPVSPPAHVPVVCPRCRGLADPGAEYCKYCGARLPAAAAPEGPPHPYFGPYGPPAGAAGTAEAPSPPRSAVPVPSPRPFDSAAQGVQAGPLASADSPIHQTRPLHGLGEPAPHARIVRIAKDGSEGTQHPIGETTDIGRTEGNIILADDPYLSPRHARIVVGLGAQGSPATLTLVDLGSTNGVFVRLRAPHRLTHGDLLLLGQQVLRFEAVTEIEGARGPAMQHGVLLFGSPAPVARGRLLQRTVEGLSRDVIYLVRDETTFGREQGDRTFPDDVFMSRRHATVRREPTGYLVTDLGSSNGTFIQITAEHVLTDGDHFRIGHHLFRVEIPSPGGQA